MRIRIRGPAGASTITLADDATVADLKREITEKTSLHQFNVKYSYPPRPLQLSPDSSHLSDLAVKLDREQLTVSAQDNGLARENSGASPVAGAPKSTSTGRTNGPIPLAQKEKPKDTPELPLLDRGATLGMYAAIKRVALLTSNSCAGDARR